MNSNNGNRNQQEQCSPERIEYAETTHYSQDFQGYGEVAHRWKYQWRNHPEESFAAAADDDDDDAAAPAIYRTPELVTIDQYDELEGKHCPKKAERANFKHIETALPRHFALVAATRQPRQYISRTELCVMTLQNAPNQNKIQSHARARIHTTCDITPFTETTLHQRVIIITRTGIAHLLVKKLAGLFWTERHMHQSALTFADLVASFISSALACEYLIGNRYYRNLPSILANETQLVGCPRGRHYQITAEDVTPAKIQETTQELQALYDANIDRLEAVIAQYARGFVSLEEIRTDPNFVQMFSKFWRLSFQTMKARSCAESRIATLRSISSGLFDEETSSADRVIACRNLFSAQCQFSRLMQYNVAHLFDNSNFNYVSFVRAAKSSQLRLCNDGLTSALLTFAAIEPRMVTAEMTPLLGDIYVSRCSLSGAANHIQTRDPVFGEMLIKHRQHVPLMKEMTELAGIRRQVFLTIRPPSYVPLQSALDSIRSGEVRSSRHLRKPDRCAPPVGMTRCG
jgi:hypothetical protein